MNDEYIGRCSKCSIWVYNRPLCDNCEKGIVFGVFRGAGLVMIYRKEDQALRAMRILEQKEPEIKWNIQPVYEREISWERSTPRLKK